MEFERDAQGRIRTVKDLMGQVIRYDYNDQGDLVGVVDRQGNTTQFTYSEPGKPHFLTQVIDPLGRTGARADYNDVTGRLETIVDANGKPVSLAYDLGSSRQTVTDQLGYTTTYVYDNWGNILTELDATGQVIERRYDDNNNVIEQTIQSDRPGATSVTTRYTYDAQSNKLTETDPLGNVTRYTYGALGRMLTETDPLGRTTYTYDKRGNLSTSKDAAGKITTYGYGLDGQLYFVTDAAQQKTGFVYDERGNVSKVTDALNNVTEYGYDNNGNKLWEQRTSVNLGTDTLQTLETRWTYDSNGRVKTMTDAENNVTVYGYDPTGNQTWVLDARGYLTESYYNAKGELTETRYSDGTRYRYNALLDQLTSIAGTGDLRQQLRTQTEYDAAGRRIKEIDQAGRETQFVYDAVGRLRYTIYPDATPEIDSDNPLDSDNPRTETQYTPDGLVKAQIDERGNRTEFRYDLAGRQTEIVYADGDSDPTNNPTTTYQYDKAGQQIAVTDALKFTTRYVYDELGRMWKTEFADRTTATTEYDVLGRRTAAIDVNGKRTEYRYDALGRLTGVKQKLSTQDLWTEYGYNEVGNLLWQEDVLNHRTNYEYDKVGRRTSVVLPLGQRSLTSYDAVGNTATSTDFNGNTISYRYDALNRLRSKAFPNLTATAFTYTATGQRASEIDARGTMVYEYDERDRLTRRTDPDGRTIAYTYDAASNRTSVTTSTGTVNYTFDERNRLDTVRQNGVTLADYTYNGVNNLVRTQFANGTEEVRWYDSLHRLQKLENKKGTAVLSSFDYTLDKVGNRQFVTEQDGRRVRYTYDDLYRLTKEEIDEPGGSTNDRTYEYGYDFVGNRLWKKETIGGRTTQTNYRYDNNDQLLREETVTGAVIATYTYDNNGNTLTKTEGSVTTTNTWDFENRLRQVNLPNGTILGYTYDANGMRVASTVNGQETRYLLDTVHPYAQVLEEYTAAGTTQVSYVYGNDLISQTQNGQTTYYLVDGLGSTRALTDEQGAIVNASTADYEAFGTLLNPQSSTVNNKYLFAGEQYDANLGDYYLRQRYYDSETGRFTRKDTYEGRLGEPLTLHKYSYTHNNPVNGIDPSGLMTLQELQVGSLIASVLISLGAFVPARIAGSGERHESDDVLIYTGTGTVFPLTSPFGHAFIEIDGEIYTFPSSKYLPDPAPRDAYLQGEQTRYGYEYNRYSINYSSKEKQILKANLISNRQALFRNEADYNLIGRNCTHYVTSSLPSTGIFFDAFVKAQMDPLGLGWGLDVVGSAQRNIVRRLSKVQRLPGTEWKFG